MLTTQAFDSYQWFRREFLNGVPEAIPGATGKSLTIQPDGLLYYYWVEVTQDTCTEASPQVLMDQYVFLLPFVVNSGAYYYDPNTGQFLVCQGEVMYLTLGLPYNTNITWYRNGEAIPGETGTTLGIVETGLYTVEAAPDVCPAFIQPLGLILDVVVRDCVDNVTEGIFHQYFKLYPNPADDMLHLENKTEMPVDKVELLDSTGRIVLSQSKPASGDYNLSLGGLVPGIYVLKVVTGEKFLSATFIKK
jgi:hypothetical protein